MIRSALNILVMSTLSAVPSAGLTLTQMVAAEVRAELARRQITQQQLAAAIGLSQASVSERLRGKTPFTTEDLEKVSAALGVHPAVLLGGNGPSPSGPVTGAYPVESNTLSHDNWSDNEVAFRSEPDVMRLTRTAA